MKTWLVAGLIWGCSAQTFGTAAEEDAGRDAEEAEAAVDQEGEAPEAEASFEAEAEVSLPPCPGMAGPTMVQVPGGYCIDSTEVTNAQYAGFLEIGGTTEQSEECAWNTTYVPSEKWPATVPDLPVVYVDWCDARAYCEWTGKRLCGRIDGGASDYEDYEDASKNQWYAACSAGGTRKFPYGGEYDEQKCNGLDRGEGERLPAGSSGCEGGYPGMWDLSGNVWEWEDSCDTTPGAQGGCRMRGGSFGFASSVLACTWVANGIRGDDGPDIGFRCCS